MTRLEEIRKVLVDHLAVRLQGRKELVSTFPESQDHAQPIQGLLGSRKLLSLPVLIQLDPVLDSPQKDVGIPQVLSDLRGKDSGVSQLFQAAQGVWLIQIRLPAAVDELQRLDEKFDLPNASDPQLHVELIPPGARPRRFGEDPVPHGSELIQGLEIQKAPEDERPNLLQKGHPKGPVSGYWSGFKKHLALPGSPAEEIMFRCGCERRHEGSVLPLRPKAKIDLEHPIPFDAVG